MPNFKQKEAMVLGGNRAVFRHFFNGGGRSNFANFLETMHVERRRDFIRNFFQRGFSFLRFGKGKEFR